MGTINLGKIKPLYKGDYSGSVTYKVLDFVRYNNSLYVCKLDSIGNLPTNTTYFDNAAYLQTPSEILTSIKTVDGTGSGLDADLLDGLHSSSFMQKISSTDNAIVRFDGTTGSVQNSGVIIDDNGNVGIGTTPTHRLDVKSSGLDTAVITAVNSANSNTIFSVNNYGNGDGGFQVNSGGGVNKLMFDASGNLLLTSGTGALGYGTGAGGTVTQITSKSTAVTLNKPSGQIITSNSSLAAGASVSFTVSNTIVGANDTVSLAAFWGESDPRSYEVKCIGVWAGIFIIRLTNITASSLSDVIRINFQVIKGAVT